MHGEVLERNIKSEIELAEDECCLIFDFGCYFPYSNAEILTFDFSLGMEELSDKKINHRYPNKGYQTISKTYGRRVSKLGYPYIMKLDNQGPMLLCIKVGIKKEVITLIFPLQTNMTKDKPFCTLQLNYNFDENKLCFTSHEILEDKSWQQYNWYNHEIEDEYKCDANIVLNPPRKASNGSYTLIYDDVITPYPSKSSDLLVL